MNARLCYTLVVASFLAPIPVSAAKQEAATKDIVQKSKADRCPAGYRINGNYCEAYQPGTQALKKEGPCPAGYHISGTYCIKN